MRTKTKTNTRTKTRTKTKTISFSFRSDFSFSYCYHHRSSFVIGSKWCVIDHDELIVRMMQCIEDMQQNNRVFFGFV